MLSTVVLTIALNLLQPAGTAPSRMAPAPIDETVPVAVPPATPTALRYYASGNRLWVLDQVVSIALLAAILFTGLSARLRDWARRIGRNWFFTIVVYFALFTIVTSSSRCRSPTTRSSCASTTTDCRIRRCRNGGPTR